MLHVPELVRHHRADLVVPEIVQQRVVEHDALGGAEAADVRVRGGRATARVDAEHLADLYVGLAREREHVVSQRASLKRRELVEQRIEQDGCEQLEHRADDHDRARREGPPGAREAQDDADEERASGSGERRADRRALDEIGRPATPVLGRQPEGPGPPLSHHAQRKLDDEQHGRQPGAGGGGRGQGPALPPLEQAPYPPRRAQPEPGEGAAARSEARETQRPLRAAVVAGPVELGWAEVVLRRYRGGMYEPARPQDEGRRPGRRGGDPNRRRQPDTMSAHSDDTVLSSTAPPVRIAILSDVHGNLPAFQAVLADIEKEGVDARWCLGDLVGYGAQPDECVALAKQSCDLCLIGNHDLVVLDKLDIEEFSMNAAIAATWTRENIAQESIDYLSGLEPADETRPIGLYHASPRDPVWEYVLSTMLANACMNACRNFPVPSLTSLPRSSKSLSAWLRYASGCCMVGTFRNTSDCLR